MTTETQTMRFKAWLRGARGLDPRTIDSRVANCKRVERFEGDLDAHFDADGLHRLMERLIYSTSDARYGREPRHSVPIDGDIRNGTATLKSAVNLYRKFRISSRSSSHAPASRAAMGRPVRKVGWLEKLIRIVMGPRPRDATDGRSARSCGRGNTLTTPKDLAVALKSIGKAAFVEHFDLFRDYAAGRVSQADCARRLNLYGRGPAWRLPNAKWVFDRGLEADALSVCVASRISDEDRREADRLLRSLGKGTGR